jgi:hypothetical protein
MNEILRKVKKAWDIAVGLLWLAVMLFLLSLPVKCQIERTDNIESLKAGRSDNELCEINKGNIELDKVDGLDVTPPFNSPDVIRIAPGLHAFDFRYSGNDYEEKITCNARDQLVFTGKSDENEKGITKRYKVVRKATNSKGDIVTKTIASNETFIPKKEKKEYKRVLNSNDEVIRATVFSDAFNITRPTVFHIQSVVDNVSLLSDPVFNRGTCRTTSEYTYPHKMIFGQGIDYTIDDGGDGLCELVEATVQTDLGDYSFKFNPLKR